MDTADKNISEWDEKFSLYLEIEQKCISDIKAISEIKNNLKILLGHQEKDDLVFYKSLIDNSYFYLSKSLSVRKIKLLKDLNLIWTRIGERLNENKQMEEVNKSNFIALLKDLRRLAEDVFQAKKNNTVLTWVKDDKIENLQDIENDIKEIIDYHLRLIRFFSSSVELEKAFFCGK